MKIGIRRWFVLAAVLAVAASLAAPTAAVAGRARKKVKALDKERDSLGKVRIVISESTTAIVPLVADQKGFLKKEGVDAVIKPVKTGGAALSSVYGGSQDIGTTAESRLIQWAVQGWRMKAIAVNNTGFLAPVLVKKDDTTSKTMADLKGKKIAIQKGSGTHIVWLRYLDKIGLSEDMFEMRYMRTSRIAAALGTGTIDGAVPWYPFAKSILNRGLARQIIGEAEIERVAKAPYPFLLYTRTSFIQKFPNTIQGITNAWVKSKNWIEANREEAAQIYHKFSTRRGKKLKMEDTRFFLKILHFKHHVWDEPMVEDLERSAAIMKKTGKIKRVPKITDFIDNRFIRKSVASN